MIQNLDIAKAYLIEANSDFDVQKACLTAEGEIGIYKPEIFSFFLQSFKNKIEIETMALLEEDVVPLEENWAMSKYPDWRVKPIWIPSQQFVSLSDRIQNIQIKLFPASSSQSMFHHGGVQ